MDVVTPPFGTLPNTVERDARLLDQIMLAGFNAKDREAEEWKRLFEKADPRFKFSGVTGKEGSGLSFIEAVWQG